MAIISFQHKGLKIFYDTGSTKGIQPAHAKKLTSILSLLETASRPEDVMFASLRTHPLIGNLKGFYAIKVNANWRITFRFKGTDVELIDYQDYH